MSAVLSWFFVLFEKLPARVLSVLGFGFVSYSGYSAVVDSLVSQALGKLNSIGGVLYNFLALGGFVTAFGILLAAVVARSGLVFIDKLAKLS